MCAHKKHTLQPTLQYIKKPDLHQHVWCVKTALPCEVPVPLGVCWHACKKRGQRNFQHQTCGWLCNRETMMKIGVVTMFAMAQVALAREHASRRFIDIVNIVDRAIRYNRNIGTRRLSNTFLCLLVKDNLLAKQSDIGALFKFWTALYEYTYKKLRMIPYATARYIRYCLYGI